MKSNHEFRQKASEKVFNAIKEMNYSFSEFTKANENASKIGTMFSNSIKQTRIINQLKELK